MLNSSRTDIHHSPFNFKDKQNLKTGKTGTGRLWKVHRRSSPGKNKFFSFATFVSSSATNSALSIFQIHLFEDRSLQSIGTIPGIRFREESVNRFVTSP
ncbi:hypothetical protein Y981_11730 [Leptospirillum ferriphilum YSK]|uniref:Uncharacterized protein n=1 Tax=Leptospirillum ferriphilum YSK TaxID=1441628 RepID=A0A059XXY9_9BACT|nr:hypothetical protein Y981_11730 [Leptospirillum ferriphilum YSK]